jgi:hypothetical protein
LSANKKAPLIERGFTLPNGAALLLQVKRHLSIS